MKVKCCKVSVNAQVFLSVKKWKWDGVSQTYISSLKTFAGNYRAVDNGSIKKHMAVHSSDKPIKCVYTSDIPY